VREVQRVDTTGVEPLQALRDETAAGVAEGTVGLDTMRDALAQEEVIGRMRRPRRKRAAVVDTMGAEDWDVLQGAEKRVGRYFVVDVREDEKGTKADGS
jgi:Glu-tRNAGln amidotransferase C subunit